MKNLLAAWMLLFALLVSAQAAEKMYSINWSHPDRKYNPDNPAESVFLNPDEIYDSHIYIRYWDAATGYTSWEWLTSMSLEGASDSEQVDLMIDPAPYGAMCFAVQTELKNGQFGPGPEKLADQKIPCVMEVCHEANS
jgi:hypothetical protein